MGKRWRRWSLPAAGSCRGGGRWRKPPACAGSPTSARACMPCAAREGMFHGERDGEPTPRNARRLVFHGKLDGETTPGYPPAMASPLDPVAVGYLIGVLAGEGHFGGDGRQPQVTLRMHVRHEKLFRWLEA